MPNCPSNSVVIPLHVFIVLHFIKTKQLTTWGRQEPSSPSAKELFESAPRFLTLPLFQLTFYPSSLFLQMAFG